MLFTRTIYQAHMEVHRRIRNTEPTVMTFKKVCLFDAAEIVVQSHIHFSTGDGKGFAADVCLLLEGVHQNQQDGEHIDYGNDAENRCQQCTVFRFSLFHYC